MVLHCFQQSDVVTPPCRSNLWEFFLYFSVQSSPSRRFWKKKAPNSEERKEYFDGFHTTNRLWQHEVQAAIIIGQTLLPCTAPLALLATLHSLLSQQPHHYFNPQFSAIKNCLACSDRISADRDSLIFIERDINFLQCLHSCIGVLKQYRHLWFWI